MVSINTIKRIIKEEIENFNLNESIQDYSEKLLKISTDFSNMAIEEGNITVPEKEFFIEYFATADAMSKRYPDTAEGLLKSLAGAAQFFSENIERFPIEIKSSAESYIDGIAQLINNSTSHTLGISESRILSEIPEPPPGEAPMTVPVDIRGVPQSTDSSPRAPRPTAKINDEGLDGWSCYQGIPPHASVEDSPSWWDFSGNADTPNDLNINNPKHAWTKFFSDPDLGPESLKFGLTAHREADPRWPEYWLANVLYNFGIIGFDSIYDSMRARDERGPYHHQAFENQARTEGLSQKLADIQDELLGNPEMAAFKKFECIPNFARRSVDWLGDIVFGEDNDSDFFANNFLFCEFKGFTWDPRGADSRRHIYCYHSNDLL